MSETLSDTTSLPVSAPPEEPSAGPVAVSPAPPVTGRRALRWLLWIDLLLVLGLFLAALPSRWEGTRGDFWLDEADYAFAAVRGFQANRWDTPDIPADPEKLVRLRHYHPPLVAYAMQVPLRYSKEDRVLRIPFVIAGAATVSLLYLCGVTLYRQCGRRRRRDSEPGAEGEEQPAPGLWDQALPRVVALAGAVVLIQTPAHIRASSHALPWAFITLWLLALTWVFLQYAETRRSGWLVGAGAVMGALFVTSEYFLVASLAVLCVLPVLLWNEIRDRERRKRALIGLAAGVGLLLLTAYCFWPAGLFGGAFKMLRHYMDMANDPWPVVLRSNPYVRAPKWAYGWWYWSMYRPYFGWYALGAIGVAALVLMRRFSAGAVSALIVTGVVLLAAHKSHIIGPEYLVHALPLLTLMGGLFFVSMGRLHPAAGMGLAVLYCVMILRFVPDYFLAGMDARSRQPRWPKAAKFLAGRWNAYDRMLAPAYGGVGRWYLVQASATPIKDWQVQGLPASNANDKVLGEIASGVWTYIAVGSTFMDYGSADPRIRQMISTWPVVWTSDEGGTGPSRLTIYRVPRGTTRHNPLPIPP